MPSPVRPTAPAVLPSMSFRSPPVTPLPSSSADAEDGVSAVVQRHAESEGAGTDCEGASAQTVRGV